jgi:hypothetical protein
MGNFATKGDSYTKPESDERYPLKTAIEAAIKAANDGLTARYTKAESDGRYPTLATYNAAIKSGNDGLAARYTKTDSDDMFLKKVDAANIYQPIGGTSVQYASVSFVNDKFTGLEKSVKTDAINLGDYSLTTNTESQLCLKRKDGAQAFCFDGKIVIQK